MKKSLLALLVFLVIPPAFAQAFPTKPVRLIIPYAPGGVSDTLARLIAADLTRQWQQQVIVDNRPGGNTIIGTDLTAKASPDGYTLLVIDPSFASNPSLYRKLPYDPRRDF